jgi:hypothetical protein
MGLRSAELQMIFVCETEMENGKILTLPPHFPSLIG